jgi:hypothetical protein
MPSYDAPYRWSVHLYGLIEEGERQGDQLAVCVRHQGAHPFYLDGCHMIPTGLGKRERVAIYARSLERQPEPEPQLLEIDVQSMAAAFVTAMRAARRDQKAESASAPQDGALRTSEGAPVRSRRVLDLGADE